jgi:hypothetical protein
MKIISLALLHKGYLDNRRFLKASKNINAIVPYPECKSPNDRISFIKVNVDGKIYQSRLLTNAEVMFAWGQDEEYFKHLCYLNLRDNIMYMAIEDLDRQATKILGEKVECI